MSEKRLKFYGWGSEGEGFTPEEDAFALARYRERFGIDRFDEIAPPRLADIALRASRLAPPTSVAAFCSSDAYDRAAHTYGKSFADYVRALAGDYANAPDVVAYPAGEADVAAVLDWAGGAQAVVTPFGGGSSVVGGVEPRVDGQRYKAAVTLDLRRMGRVREVDRPSRAARIEAGASGPPPAPPFNPPLPTPAPLPPN